MTDISTGLDIRESSRTPDGQVHTLDRRFFMQLLAFGESYDLERLIEEVDEGGFSAVIYADINDPWGIGLLTFSEDSAFFVTELRSLLPHFAF